MGPKPYCECKDTKKIQNAKFKMQNYCKIQNAECKMQNAKLVEATTFSTPDTLSTIAVVGNAD